MLRPDAYKACQKPESCSFARRRDDGRLAILILDPGQGRGYILTMAPRRTSKKDTPAKLAGRMRRRWRVVPLRAKGEILGTVEARDVVSAKAAAAVQFGLDEIQRNRHGAGLA